MRRSSATTGLGVAALMAVTVAVPAQADPRVTGDIGVAYERLGGARGFLGQPVTGEIRTPDGRGAYVAFQNGAIYWSPATGSHELHGSIRAEWARTRWEAGPLGFPATDEVRTPNGRGAYNAFQGGSIYWSPATGAREVRGAIRDAWARTGWEAGILGFPTTAESRTPDGRGAYNHFQGGSVYWSPGNGAWPVYGAIREAWFAEGAEEFLGFPITAETDFFYGGQLRRHQNFENATIIWSATDGVEVIMAEG